MNESMTYIRGEFPDTVILPTIGNNDVIVHSSMSCLPSMMSVYFIDLLDIFFPKALLPAGFDYNGVKETFLKGGYYRHDFKGKSTSLLALNSIYFMATNNCSMDHAQAQMQWVEQQLAENEKLNGTSKHRQFILSMHVFPGIDYNFGKNKDYWYQNFTSQFIGILDKYQDSVTMVAGAHLHKLDFRVPISREHPGLAVPILVTPSITPVYMNNPGYTVATIDETTREFSDL